jgi:thiosulfate/3-mercaptopyruvate sulfurtransferase
MLIQTNPRFQSLTRSLGLSMLLPTLAILLPWVNVKRADTTNPSLRGVRKVGVGAASLVPALGVDGMYGNDGSEPWTRSQVQQPADLANELSDPKGKKALIIYVGFESLYRNAHISGALFHGPAWKPEGLEDLKEWAQNVPRNRAIVIYCGCCPFSRCPNIRPAFKALHEMGFTRLKVLFLETDLARDWVQKGFPVQKGK